MSSLDSFRCLKSFSIGAHTYHYFSLKTAERNGLTGISRLPMSMKILLENLLRHENGKTVKKTDIEAFVTWLQNDGKYEHEIAYHPARVLMQDFTGVPAIVDLAAMRDAVKALGGDPQRINPHIPVDLVIDHSVIVDEFGTPRAFQRNVEFEYERNIERYKFLKWGQAAFKNFRVVPPGTGICHQVNLEYLGQTIWTKKEKYTDYKGRERHYEFAFPDTLVGTDSHTTMINSLSVLGWGVGGIEAEACMLGQPLSMLLPEVVGFQFTGALKEGVTATDLVLTVTQMLRAKGVVGKFVEFYGSGLQNLSLEDRATISNMAPEYGATCGFFPIDHETLRYLTLANRSLDRVKLVEKYARTQGLFRSRVAKDPQFTTTLALNLADVTPSIAGPKRPEERLSLENVADNFAIAFESVYAKSGELERHIRYPYGEQGQTLGHGDVVIAAITSCTNTSNPVVLITAALMARKAREKGLSVKPWVKTSLAPGSQVVAAYLERAGLQEDLDALGFNLVGFGCTTCIGNSGPLSPGISAAVTKNDLIVASVLSGNRNFEGRINPDVQANFLASPPLVVAYALAGTVTKNLTTEPLGFGFNDQPVYLKDIWPSAHEVESFVKKFVTRSTFQKRYAHVFAGDDLWADVQVPRGQTYAWDKDSTYIRNPPYFEGMTRTPPPLVDITDARILAIFGDKITTDHISPAGSIRSTSPAGQWLMAHKVAPPDFNQYGTRRGNHEVMMRGTFANIRIKNQMLKDADGVVPEGGETLYFGSQAGPARRSIYDAAMAYAQDHTPLVVFAGAEYGNGSSRDWAAKGTNLLGVRAVIAQSFERIHRSNLVGMGVLPLTFEPGTSWISLGLQGDERISIKGLTLLKPRQSIMMEITSANGERRHVPLICQILTQDECEYFRQGGILPYVIRQMVK